MLVKVSEDYCTIVSTWLSNVNNIAWDGPGALLKLYENFRPDVPDGSPGLIQLLYSKFFQPMFLA